MNPLQGTYYHASTANIEKAHLNHGTTLWDNGSGPFFKPSQSVFTIKQNHGLDKEPIRIGTDTISRLQQKPAHKPMRSKYENNKDEQEKTNKAQTKEDFFRQDNLEWITSLRPLDLEMPKVKDQKDQKTE